MSVTFRPATRENVGLLIGLSGASGSGKTFSAMRLAQGIVGPEGRFAVIDTEARRALHYADRFRFDHAELRAPFRPQAYADAIKAADEAGYAAILIDSMSHEYEGGGGILEWAAELEAGTPKPGVTNPRTYGNDWWQDWDVKPIKSPGNWKEPKSAHKRLVSRLLQCRAHLIFCLRAEDKIEIVRRGGKTEIIPPEQKAPKDRWVPICEKRFMFEMTASFVLTSDAPGVPLPVKLQEQHKGLFPQGQPITEEHGAALAAWAGGSQQRADDGLPPPSAASTAGESVPSASAAQTPAASTPDDFPGLSFSAEKCLEAIARQMSEPELKQWGKDNAEVIDGLAVDEQDRVRGAWTARRDELRASA